MYLAAGGPLLRRDPISVDERVPSFEEYVGTSAQETYSLNPTQQFRAIGRLKELEPITEELTLDEFGQETKIRRGGLDPSDPRARRMSLDEANERGKDIGLRFSEPPTQGQFDYLSELKISENERGAVLAQAPGAGAWITGRVADLAASAIDPLNIASAFVPVIGQSRYAKMVASIGTGRARLVKGAAEGFVGSAMIAPITYSQAQVLQQNYDMNSVMADLAVGTVLGSGLHWGGGKLLDIYRGDVQLKVGGLLRQNAPQTPGPVPRDSRRSAMMSEGENASRAAAMDPETRRAVLNAAVKAVANDVEPRINEIFKGSPELGDLGMPDKRFPATLRLRAPLTAADYARGGRAAGIMDALAHAMVAKIPADAKPLALFEKFRKRYPNLRQVEPYFPDRAEFNRIAGRLIEDPNQLAVYDPTSGRLIIADGASLGAIRHEIERAIDDLYDHKGDSAGGYRFGRKDADGPVAFRQALKALYEDEPGRAPRAERTGEEAVDLFSRRDSGNIMNPNGQKVADNAWNIVQEGKDKDLETLIKEEELDAIESIAQANHGAVRDLGILEKVIPIEERKILAEADVPQALQSVQRDLFRSMDELAEGTEVNQALRDAEVLMAAGPERLGAVVRGELTEGQVIKQMVDDGFVTRDQALRSIRIYTMGLKDAEGNVVTLSGEKLEQAVKLVKAGEDIDVAVKAATDGGELLAAAQKASDEAEVKFELPDDDPDLINMDLEDYIVKVGRQIIDDNQITSTHELAEYEGRIVAEEHAKLEENPATQDLSDDLERVEFNEANRSRALREGASPAERRARAGEQLQRQGRAIEDGLFASTAGRNGAPIRGAGDVIERERGASGGERAAPETVASYGGWAVPRRVITPDSSIEVTVEPRIVELSDLVHAEGALQVRDRARKESIAEARERALKLDPEQLLPNRVADSGSPIVVQTPDGKYTIISGNGRTMSLRQVYDDETMGGKAQAYRERLGEAADGYRRPVLVSVITDELTEGDLVSFAERANRVRIAEMSVTEKAQRDADVAGYEIMSLYQGGEFTKRENQAFLRAFMRKVATPQELGEMSKNGVLTKPGLDRLNAAVLAAAYDDANVLSLMLESADLNIKSIANAYRDVAPAFMKLRAEIAQGLVREEMDITAYMMEAARFVNKARDEGVKIGNALAQVDVLSPIDPVVEALIRQFYNPQLTRANSALRIAEVLKQYADIASQKRTGGFLEDQTGAGEVLSTAQRRAERIGVDDEAEAILGADEAVPGASPDPVGRAASEPASPEPRETAPEPGEGTGPAATDRQAAEAIDLEALTVKELRAKAKADGIKLRTGITKKADIIGEIRKARGTEAAPAQAAEPQMRPEGRVLSDEEIDALPDPVEPDADRALINPAQRTAFYDFLEGDGKVGGAGTVARALKTSVDEAGALIDEAVEAGWLTINSKDQVIRVPKNRRPGRPDEPEAFADVIQFPGRFGTVKALKSQHELDVALVDTTNERISSLQTEAALLLDKEQELGSLSPDDEARLSEISGQVDALREEIYEAQTRIQERYERIDDSPKRAKLLEERGEIYKEFRPLNLERNDLNDRLNNGEALTFAEQRRLQILDERIAETRARIEAKDAEITKLQDDLIKDFADAPRGWGWAGEPSEADIVRSMQQGAVAFLARKAGTSPDKITRAFGFKDAHDYVRVAREQGYLPGDAYDRMRQNVINQRLEAELQATLSIQKAFDRAMQWGRVPEGVQMRIMDEMFHGDWTIAGRFEPLKRLISVSRKIGKRQPGETVPHELFHATRHAKLFTESEWAIAREEFANQRFGDLETERYNRYLAYWRDAYARLGMDISTPEARTRISDKLIEEWMATEYGKWQDARDKAYDSVGPLERLFRRVKDFVDGLTRAFGRWVGKKDGPADVEEIFKAIENGTIAQRWVEWGMGKTGPDNPLSRSNSALADMVDDLNQQIRTIAKDDSEAIGNKQAEALAALAPCATRNL